MATWHALEVAQGYRVLGFDYAGRPIKTLVAPAGTAPFIPLNNVSDPENTSSHYDGIGCNADEGWLLTGCWISTGSGKGGEDHVDQDALPYNNGCITNEFDNPGVKVVRLSISCMRTGR